MTNDRTDPGGKLDELRRKYQAIEAPADTVARAVLAAEANVRPHGTLRLAYVGTALIVGVLALLPFMTLRDAAPDSVSMLPSLTAVSRAMPAKPTVSIPSLGSIRSVAMPVMPKRPAPTPGQDTQSYFDTDDGSDSNEEKTYELV